MVEPKYEEVKDIITDDQALSIYAWAVAPIDMLRSFRDKEKMTQIIEMARYYQRDRVNHRNR